MEENGRKGRTLAEKLDHLFKTVHPAGRGEYSYEEVSAALAEAGGPTISASYLWLLRKGKKANPTIRHLESVASFFGVPAAYFLDDGAAERIDGQLALLTAMRDQRVLGVAMRSAPLSEEGLAAITALVEHVRRIERIPEDP